GLLAADKLLEKGLHAARLAGPSLPLVNAKLRDARNARPQGLRRNAERLGGLAQGVHSGWERPDGGVLPGGVGLVVLESGRVAGRPRRGAESLIVRLAERRLALLDLVVQLRAGGGERVGVQVDQVAGKSVRRRLRRGGQGLDVGFRGPDEPVQRGLR